MGEPDERQVYDLYVSGRASAVLAACVRLGLFERLLLGPLGPVELASALGIEERGARALLRCLWAMGLVTSEARPELTEVARRTLIPGAPGDLTPLIDLEVEHFVTPAAVLAAVRANGTSVYGDRDTWQAHADDPEAARRFTAAMHGISTRPARALAERLPVRGTILDLGAGSGVYVIELLRANQDLRAILVDLPSVCSLADGYLEAAGVADRAASLAGDMFSMPLPACDAVLLAQILHDWPYERGEHLVRRAWDALRPGGRLIVCEKLIDDGGGPLATALVTLDMLFWTEGQQYRADELFALLERVGFEGVERVPLHGYWSAVVARRPSR